MNRAALAARIKALLAKTVQNGATEAEALSAIEKARELMDKHHMDGGAIGMEEEGTTRYDQPHEKTKVQSEILLVKSELVVAIGRFTSTRTFWNPSDRLICFFGLRSDVDFASWLSDSLSTYCLNQAATYRLDCALFDTGKLTRDGEASFLRGAVNRINERLKELTATHSATSDGKALIPLKNQIVARDWAKLNLRLSRSGGSSLSGSDANAAAAGRAAGDRASFGRPVTNRTAGLLR